jgi:hypothetical protein
MRFIHANGFYHDGRGPTLVTVHLRPGSAHIDAVDYQLPDSDGNSESFRHLKFHRAQVFMFTPEEVENYSTTEVDWSHTERGALVGLGRTKWLTSFDLRHLERCKHYRAMFYDEFLDIICARLCPFGRLTRSGSTCQNTS